MNTMMRLLFVPALVLMLPLAPEVRADAPPYQATVDDDGVQRVEIVGGSYFFEPDYVVVKAGVPVELVVTKEEGVAPHSLVIDEPAMGLDIHTMLDTEAKRIRFTPEVTGIAEFYCDERLLWFRSHHERGMAGTLEVVE